jgi:type I restriction enzyme S subunit
MDTTQVPAGYKLTELGAIPQDWEIKTLGELGECIIGLTYSPSDIDESGILVLRSSNIQDGNLDLDDQVRVKKAVSDRLIVREGDLLVCVRNGSRRLIGKNILIDSRVAGETFGAFMSVYRSPLNTYIAQAFSSGIITKQIDENLGATINQITNKDLNSFRIPLPPLAEQQAIAEALGEMDALLVAQRARLAKQRALKQGLLQGLLSGQQRLPGFSGEWQELSVKKDFTLHARIGWQGLTTNEYLDEGPYYLVTGTDFIKNKIAWETCHFVEKYRYDQDAKIKLRVGDLLVTKDGTIGKVAYVDRLPKPATLNSGVFVLRPKSTSHWPLFISYVFQSEIFTNFIDQLTAGSTIVHLYQKDFVHFKFSVPSLAEQKAIAAVLSEADAYLAALEAEHAKTQLLKQGMMQNLLTGKLRLV